MKVWGMSDLIFRVLNLIKSIDDVTGISDLDSTSREILQIVANAHDAGNVLYVGDIARRYDLGSAPNIYSKLKVLTEAGWIKAEDVAEDGRRKRLSPSEKALKSFRAQSDALKTLLEKSDKLA